jgi:hypothetical protein
MAKDEKRNIDNGTEQSDAMSEAEIDNNLMATFPASDPPSWTLGTNHREETKSEEGEAKSNRQEE